MVYWNQTLVFVALLKEPISFLRYISRAGIVTYNRKSTGETNHVNDTNKLPA